MDENDNCNAEANVQQQYYRSKTGVFPVRWTAPEAIEGSSFSPASDVWSFAIVMVEIYQNGAEPYNGMSLQSVIPYVMAGTQIERPAGCTAAIYELMCECWSMDPSESPTFARVVEAMTFYYKKVHPGDADGPAAPPTAVLDDSAEDKAELEFDTAMKRLTDPQRMYSHGSAAATALLRPLPSLRLKLPMQSRSESQHCRKSCGSWQAALNLQSPAPVARKEQQKPIGQSLQAVQATLPVPRTANL